MKEIKNVTIVGMGALGLLYGSMMAAGGAQVRWTQNGLFGIRIWKSPATENLFNFSW